MKGKLEEAKQVLCYAAGVNKKTIPLSLLDKVRDLWPGVGAWAGGLRRGLFPPHPFRWDLGPEGVPSPLLEEKSDGKMEPCQGKARGQAGPGRQRARDLMSPAGGEQAGVLALPVAGPACPVVATAWKEGGFSLYPGLL